MKSAIKNVNYKIVILIFGVLLKGFLVEMIAGDDYCDGEDVAMLQWYGQMLSYSKKNENATQSIKELREKVHTLEAKIVETHKILKTMQVEMEKLQHHTNDNIVIQRRLDGSVDFFRSWSDYKQGFGNSSGEFFIGLEKLHRLTNTAPYELLVVMEDWANNRAYALYDQFIVGSEQEKYALNSLGTYSGSAGDSMGYELHQKFSTRDRDNDSSDEHCAVRYTGAWWYNACHQSNLNGRYLKGKIGEDEKAQGVHWHPFKGHLYSLKFVEMTIRPK